MKVLTYATQYDETIQMAESLTGEYHTPVIFHCYWNGALNEKHLYSIMSFYYFNVMNHKHKIVLWLENNVPTKFNEEIEKYAEIRTFSLHEQMKGTFLENRPFYFNRILSYYSDVVRYVLLYKYGGCWFDLDCLCLRNLDPLFSAYGNEISVYQWEDQSYPNGAVYISLEPESEKMKYNIEFIIQRARGWGFQEANLTYDLPMNLCVLPCSWFDGAWIPNPYGITFDNFFDNTDKVYDFDTFFKGGFCFHWHNRWNKPIHANSAMGQLIRIIENGIRSNSSA